MPPTPWFRPTPVHCTLPVFSANAAVLARDVQRTVDRSDLADPLDGLLSADTLLVGTGNAPGQALTVGHCGMAVPTALPQPQSLVAAANEGERQTLAYPRTFGQVPVAWACSTAIYRHEGRYISDTQITARREQDFHHVALRRHLPHADKVYEQYLYVVGTQAAVDEIFVVSSAERAACRARLACLLGATGGQLVATYDELTWRRFHTMYAASMVTLVSLLCFSTALAVPQTGPQDERRRAQLGMIGAVVSLSLGLCIGGVAYAQRRPDSQHVEALVRVRQLHAELLVQPHLTRTQRRDILVQLRDEVARRSHLVQQDPQSLPLLPIAQQALDELYAYWLPDVFDGVGVGAGDGLGPQNSSPIGASSPTVYDDAADELA